MSLVGTSEMSAGGPLRRSHSKSALFNEDVLEVSLLKSPARKTCFRTPYQSGVQGGLSDGVQALLIAQQSRPVTIYDRLQLCNFVVNVTHTHTVEYLKTRIQSKQGSDGLGSISMEDSAKMTSR